MKGETRVLDIQDVLIIGGGPCGLAVAARLHESTPSALFTDSEHQRVSGVHL
jgi:cation diffusion facilitator CzcD-associated flavoprotein CzcO